MPYLAPIPLELLPDSITVAKPDTTASYGGKFLDPVEIAHVRYERAEALNPDTIKLADGASGRIWVDAANSAGAFRIPAGSKVVLGGETLHVVSCAEFRPFGPVHHWELDVK